MDVTEIITGRQGNSAKHSGIILHKGYCWWASSQLHRCEKCAFDSFLQKQCHWHGDKHTGWQNFGLPGSAVSALPVTLNPAAQLLLLLFCLLAVTSNDCICTEGYPSGVREGRRCWFGGMHSITFRITFDKTCKVRCVHLDALEASFQAFWKLSVKVSAYDFRNLSIRVWHNLARVVMAGNSLEPSEPTVPVQLDERSDGLRRARLSSTAQPWNQGNRSLPSGLIGCYLISEQKYLNW